MPNITVFGQPAKSLFRVQSKEAPDIYALMQELLPEFESYDTLPGGTVVTCYKHALCDQSDWPPAPNPSKCDSTDQKTSSRTFYTPNLGECKYAPLESNKCKQQYIEIGRIEHYKGTTCDPQEYDRVESAGKKYRCVN